MSFADLERVNAANYTYQKERADRLQRVLCGLLLDNGPARISAATRALIQGPLDEFALLTTDDVMTGDLRFSVVRK